MARPGVYLIEVDWDLQITVSPERRFIAFLIMVPPTSSQPLTNSVGTPNMTVAGCWREKGTISRPIFHKRVMKIVLSDILRWGNLCTRHGSRAVPSVTTL